MPSFVSNVAIYDEKKVPEQTSDLSSLPFCRDIVYLYGNSLRCIN